MFFQYIKAFEESTRKSLDLIFHAIKIVHFTSFPRFEIEVLKEFSLAVLKLDCRSVRHSIVHHIEHILLGGVVFREYNCMNIKIFAKVSLIFCLIVSSDILVSSVWK